jgi:glycine hydroxymethyltransferase
MPVIVDFIDQIISNVDNEEVIASVRKQVNNLMQERPMFAW